MATTAKPSEVVFSPDVEGLAVTSFVDAVEEGKLDFRYWLTFIVFGLTFAIDYFDLFVVGFIVSDFAPSWHLTYSQIGVILMAAGIGSIIGALLGGNLADRIGRKPVLLLGNVCCGISGGALALVPDGAWLLVAVLRLLTGLSIGAIAATTVALIVERTPRRHRTLITGLNLVAPSIGVMLASVIAGIVLGAFGWRVLAALGSVPLLLVPLIYLIVPESVHWQAANGHEAAARASAARILGQSVDHLPAPPPITRHVPPGLKELYRDRGRFWLVFLMSIGSHSGTYGMYLWGPAILAATMATTPAHAASMFVLVSVFGVSGKVIFAILPAIFGRWKTGVFGLIVGILSLIGAAFVGGTMIGAIPLILICFMGISLSLEGGSANIHPYSAEVFPVQLASRGVGLAQAGSGLAKILGPVSLAVIAGSSDVIKPAATTGAVTPAFLFFAGCAAVALICMLIVRIETKGRRLDMTAE